MAIHRLFCGDPYHLRAGSLNSPTGGVVDDASDRLLASVEVIKAGAQRITIDVTAEAQQV